VQHHVHIVPEACVKCKNHIRMAAEISEHLAMGRSMYQKECTERHSLMIGLPTEFPVAALEETLDVYVREHDTSVGNTSVGLVQAYNEAFLALLRSHYWHLLESGEIADTRQAEMLFTSIALSFHASGSHIADLEHVLVNLKTSHNDAGVELATIEQMIDDDCEIEHPEHHEHHERAAKAPELIDADAPKRRESVVKALGSSLSRHNREKNHEHWAIKFCESTVFAVGISIILIINAVFILLEQTQRKGDNYHHIAWITVEIIFAVIFTLEFFVKIIGEKCWYFLDPWNLFDFSLLLLSFFGLAMEALAGNSNDAGGSEVSNEARIFRFNRLFRVLRVLRLFRLFKLAKSLAAKFSNDAMSFVLAEHLKTIAIARAFVTAHLNSQKDLLAFFGDQGNVSGVECARVLLESQTAVYKMCAIAATEANHVDPRTLAAMKLLRENVAATGELSNFILEAHSKGVISSREAETITHTLDGHVMAFTQQMTKTMGGRTSSKDLPALEPQKAWGDDGAATQGGH